MKPSLRDAIAVASACTTLLSGIVLCFWSFARHGAVGQGELWYFGQTLVYAGSIFGVALYVHGRLGEMENRRRP